MKIYCTFEAVLLSSLNSFVEKVLPVENFYPNRTTYFSFFAKTPVFRVLALFFLFSSVVSIANAQLTGIKTIAATGGDYTSLQAAIAALNASGVGAGGVTFNVPAGWTETFTSANAGMITATGTATNPIVFQKSGAGANPLITAYPIGIGSNDYVIAITGGSYITIDGIDVQKNSPFVNASQSVEYGYFIVNTASAGCKYNTIKNCTITLDRSNLGSIGVFQYVNSPPSDASRANSYNTYENITVTNSYNGIYLQGNATYPDIACEIKNCTVGSATANDIGNGTASNYGIKAENQSGVSIHHTEVRNVTNSSGADPYGIYLKAAQGISNIYNCKVHDLKDTKSSSNNIVYGIYVDVATGNTVNVYNNFIYDVFYANTSATSTIRQFLLYTNGAGTVNIYHNSILSSNTLTNQGNACIYVNGNTVNIKNNILKNALNCISPGGNGYSFCIYIASGTLNTSDYNIFDVPASGRNCVGYFGVNKITLANWQSATSKDANSKNITAAFINTTIGSVNLHLNLTVPDVNYNCIAISSPSITTDIDGESRDTPLIGADEVIFCIKPTAYSVTSSGNLCDNDAELRLNGSQSGVTYELYKDNVLVSGSAQVGTGDDDPTWSLSSVGTYTIKTAAVDGYCSLAMTGSVSMSSITPVITTQPGTISPVCQNATPTDLTVVVANAPGTLSYQWYSSTDVTIGNADDAAVGDNSDSHTPSTDTPGDLYLLCGDQYLYLGYGYCHQYAVGASYGQSSYANHYPAFRCFGLL